VKSVNGLPCIHTGAEAVIVRLKKRCKDHFVLEVDIVAKLLFSDNQICFVVVVVVANTQWKDEMKVFKELTTDIVKTS